MILSQKYSQLERQISNELRRKKPDFEMLFYWRSLQWELLGKRLDLLTKGCSSKVPPLSEIRKRLDTIKQKYNQPETA